MIVAVLPMGHLAVKSGIRRHIDLAAQNRIDPCRLRFFIKINHAKHYTVIRDGSRCHAEFFDSFYIFLDFIGTVQQTVLCMDV